MVVGAVHPGGVGGEDGVSRHAGQPRPGTRRAGSREEFAVLVPCTVVPGAAEGEDLPRRQRCVALVGPRNVHQRPPDPRAGGRVVDRRRAVAAAAVDQQPAVREHRQPRAEHLVVGVHGDRLPGSAGREVDRRDLRHRPALVEVHGVVGSERQQAVPGQHRRGHRHDRQADRRAPHPPDAGGGGRAQHVDLGGGRPGTPAARLAERGEAHIASGGGREGSGLGGLVVSPGALCDRHSPGRSVRTDRDGVPADRPVRRRVLARQVAQPDDGRGRAEVHGEGVRQGSGDRTEAGVPERRAVPVEDVLGGIGRRGITGDHRPARSRQRGTSRRIPDDADLGCGRPWSATACLRLRGQPDEARAHRREHRGLLPGIVVPGAADDRVAPVRAVRAHRDGVAADRPVRRPVLSWQVCHARDVAHGLEIDRDAVRQRRGRGAVQAVPERRRAPVDHVPGRVGRRLVAGARGPSGGVQCGQLGRESVRRARFEHRHVIGIRPRIVVHAQPLPPLTTQDEARHPRFGDAVTEN